MYQLQWRSRLQLEVAAETKIRAERVLPSRQDSNVLLTTVLWGNANIIALLTDIDLPRLLEHNQTTDDPTLQKNHASDEKPVVLADLNGEPQLLL